MKIAVIYYSLDGNCALVAECIKELYKADVFEIKTKDNKKRSGFAKMIWGVFQVMTNKKPAILPLQVEIGAYDLIILGAPVWAGSPAPAMNSFLDAAKITGKKLAVYCCHAGGKGAALDKFKAMLSGNTITGETDFDKADKGEIAALRQKTGDWVKTLTS